MKHVEANKILHVYTRVSTVAQEDKGTSLASQEQHGRQKAAQLGLSVQIWNEGGRSSNHDDVAERPELHRLVTEMRKGTIKHLFVYDASRLSRNDAVASLIRGLCNRHQITLYTKDGDYDFANPVDMFVRQMLDGIAQFDNASRAMRTRTGKLMRAKDNRWHGGPPPFGYRIEQKRLVVDKAEAAQVQEIYQRYARGDSTLSIRAYLDISGVLPRRGGSWTTGSILKILSNTHYLGYHSYTDKALNETVRVECPPVLTASLAQAVRKKRADVLARKGQVNRTRHFYLLRDFMFCGDCGSPMGARTRPVKHEHFYYCPQKERQAAKGVALEKKFSKKTGCSFKRSMNIEQADQLVWDAVIKVHTQDTFNRLFAEGAEKRTESDADLNNRRKAIRVQEKELKGVQEAMAELEVERRLGKVTPEVCKGLMKRLALRKDAVEARLEALTQEITEAHEQKRWGQWIQKWGNEAPKHRLTPDERKEYLSGIVERIDVWFKPETKEHVLEVKFVRSIVSGSTFKSGSSRWRVGRLKSKKLRLDGTSHVKRHTPVGIYSVTVE